MVDRKTPDDRAPVPVRPPLRLYDIFVTVAEIRSFVGASKVLGISQPAVSQAIARLEDYYTGSLFVRRPGASLTITPAGEALLPFAKAILHAADQSYLKVDAAANGQHGRLSVGFYPGIASGPLRAGLLSFHAEYPELELNVVEGMPGELHAQFCDQTLDLVIAAFMPDLANPAFGQESLWSEQLVVLIPGNHGLAERASLRWSDVAKLPIILRAAGGDMSGYRAILAGVSPRSLRCKQYAVSRGTLVQLVTMGFGVTITFASTVVPTPGVVAIPIDDERANVQVDGIWHAFDENTARLRLLHHLRDAARQVASIVCL
jgi:DNA-binding transcriptional LysR family regulator